MSEPTVGVIGGSGLYEIEGLANVERVKLQTPFGNPSDEYIVGRLAGRKLIFLPRHGRGHRYTPSEINYRANIFGFRQLGAEQIISLSAVGSMREDVRPGDLVMVHQFFDRTKDRPCSFFGDGIVGHVAFADPICVSLSKIVAEAARTVGARVHEGGTYVCIEGPQFSTRAESRIYRQWGVDVIGMTNLTESKLAREAEICYATIALVTDYDCWHDGEEDVTVEAVLAVLRKNTETAKRVVAEAAKRVVAKRTCSCPEAAKNAILTDLNAVSPEARKRVELLFGKYL